MNVLILTDGIYPHVTGGMQKHSYYLVKYLLKEQHKVTLVHCGADSSTAHVLFNTSPEFLREIKIKFPESVKFPGHYIYNSYRYSKIIYSQIKHCIPDYDFIYVQGFCGWYTLKKISDLQKPVTIVNFHGLEMFQRTVGFKQKMQAKLLAHFVKKNLLYSKYVHSLGGKLTDILVSKIGVPMEKIREVPIGIEKKWIANPDALTASRKRQFVFIGRNEPRKGFPYLINAFEKIKEGFHLHIIGPFEKKNDANFTFHGLIKNEDEIIRVLDNCEVLINVSFSEGMPTVILEAMSRGCAIAATDVGATNIEVGPENGWLFEPANKVAISNCLLEILGASEEDLLIKRKNSIDKAEKNFLWDNLPKEIFK